VSQAVFPVVWLSAAAGKHEWLGCSWIGFAVESKAIGTKEKEPEQIRLDGDEVVYAFTQTLRRAVRSTFRCSNRASSKTSLPTLIEQ
jgi:hypothetical protein